MLTHVANARNLRCYPAPVLSAELELVDLDPRHWAGWWSLLVPPRVQAYPAWALGIVDGPALIKAVIKGKGAIDPAGAPLRGRDPAALAAWSRQLGVAASVVVERGLVAQLSTEIETALRLEQDLVEQGLVALRALKRHAGTAIWTDPPILDLLPAPSYDAIQKTFDLLVPDRSALVAYVIADDRSRIEASVIAVKQGGDIVRVATHRAIADLVPEASFARDWERQHRRVATAVEERFAKPSIALFIERATVMRIVTGPSDQLARELNAKRVIIEPAPAWLLGLLGGATVAAMAGRAARGLASMLPQSARDRASALATRAKDRIKDSGPFATLGFDPLELWAQLKVFYRE